MKRSSGRILPAAALALAAAVWPGSLAFATPARAAALPAAQAEAGSMLPLLAAMAIGIAVSVIAVLAFLQMTSRGKSTKDEESRHPDIASFAPQPGQRSADGQRDGSEEADGAGEADEADNADEADKADDAMGYTVPLRSIDRAPDRPDQRRAEPAVAGEPRLIGVAGEFVGASYRLADRPLAIGRDSHQCELVYPDGHAEISRKHCTVSYDAERRVFSLVDHGSSNGTYLRDGTRLASGDRRELRSGDRFALSGEEQWFEVDD